jgi:hypothetical protein
MRGVSQLPLKIGDRNHPMRSPDFNEMNSYSACLIWVIIFVSMTWFTNAIAGESPDYAY